MKRGRYAVHKRNEIFQVEGWLGVIYTVDRSINDPCNAWLLGGVRQRGSAIGTTFIFIKP